MLVAVSTIVGVGSGAASAASATTPTSSPGYWLVGADGGVFAFNAPFYGSAEPQCPTPSPNLAPSSCASGIAPTPDGGGYTVVWGTAYAPPGFGVYAPTPQFGDATGANSCSTHNTGAIADAWNGISSTPTGKGFWLVGAQGGIEACGDAQFYGDSIRTDTGPSRIGISPTPDGRGYWEVASDGGVFSFGDAQYHGSMGGQHLSFNQRIVGMAATPDGQGYWLVGADGGVFCFGDAQFHGSMGGQHLNEPIVGMAATPDGKGYWLTASDGGVFSFGDAPFEGSMAGEHLREPIVGIAAKPGP